MKYLDDPIGETLKNGYPVCADCRRYENHDVTFCQHCGGPLVLEKEMTWRRFIREQADVGAGPILSFHAVLEKASGREGMFSELPKRYERIYKEADKVSSRNEFRGKGRKSFAFRKGIGKVKFGRWSVGAWDLGLYVEHLFVRANDKRRLKPEVIRALDVLRKDKHDRLAYSAGFERNDTRESHALFEEYLAKYVEGKEEAARKAGARRDITLESLLEAYYGKGKVPPVEEGT